MEAMLGVPDLIVLFQKLKNLSRSMNFIVMNTTDVRLIGLKLLGKDLSPFF